MNKNYALYKVPSIGTVQEMIINSANEFENLIALRDLFDSPFNQLTYKELLTIVMKFGKALKNIGLKERSHIAVIGENRIQWGLTYLTAMTFNYVIVPVDKNLSENEILNILFESDSEAIVFSDTFNSFFEEKKNLLKKLKVFINMDLKKSSKEVFSMVELINNNEPVNISELPQINPDEMAVIIFTSGSLARAKGVMLSQRNLATNLSSMTSMLEITRNDRFLSVLPIHHTYECTCGFLCPLYRGASVHYARSLKTVLDDLQKSAATILLGVPLLFEKMFKRIYKSIKEDKTKSVIIKPLIKITNFVEKVGWKGLKKLIFKELHQRFGGNIRVFIAGGAAPDPNISRGLREFGFNFVQGYGLTETSPILTLNRLYNFKDEAAGLPLPGVQIKINNPNEDGIGEIYAKGPNVMLGYYKNPQLTKDAFDDGWFKTGDVGIFDKDNFLHINGRKKNVIIAKNGKNVFPEEIEDILNREPYVLESLCFGEKDSKNDEIVATKIVVDTESFIEYSEKNGQPITDELINEIIGNTIRRINENLPIYKQIKKFYIRQKEFEKTTTQKIKRYLAND